MANIIVKLNAGEGATKLSSCKKSSKFFKLLLPHFLECAVNYIVKLYLVHFRDFISVMFMLRQFSVKLCHKQKPTFFFAIFSAGNKFTFTFTIFTYQAVDAPISNFVIFLTQDIVKLLLDTNR